MGAYLSQPITEKHSEVGADASIEYAVSAMQGWRTEMEDAHVSVLNIDEKGVSFFGVFDGHGGKEVAKFVALHIVEEFRQSSRFNISNIPTDLKTTYLSLDTRIRSEKSRQELLELSSEHKTEQATSLERVIKLDRLPKILREAIVASHDDGSDMTVSSSSSEYESDEEGDMNSASDEDEVSGNRPRVNSFPIALSDSSSSDSESENEETPQKAEERTPDDTETTRLLPVEEETAVEAKVKSQESEKSAVLFKTSESTETEYRSADEAGAAAGEDGASPVAPHDIQKHMLSTDSLVKEAPTSVFVKQAKERGSRRKVSAIGGFLSFMCPFPCLLSSNDLPDEEEPLFISHPSSLTSFMTSERESPSPIVKEAENGRQKFDWDPTELQPSELIDITPPPSEPEITQNERNDGHTEKPQVISEIQPETEPEEITNGRDVTVAGCTAVVAVIVGETLFVANAGDSRCVLCHDGIALPMSRDHKPTDPQEYVRIKNAGGFVSDGRVNGCLNLSRALGDMEYKKSPNLKPEEYMITANPDINSVDLQTGDHFLILACDGIWDVVSDQEACDFVISRLKQNYTLEQISWDLCDYCLADDAEGSGEGCDNMTVMIVLLKSYATTELISS